jgi:hypothetical protein
LSTTGKRFEKVVLKIVISELQKLAITV